MVRNHLLKLFLKSEVCLWVTLDSGVVIQAPNSDSVSAANEAHVLVWPLGDTEALHKFVDWFDHAGPLEGVRALHLFHQVFGLLILGCELGLLQLLG